MSEHHRNTRHPAAAASNQMSEHHQNTRHPAAAAAAAPPPAEEAEHLFSSEPRSFRMDRKSPQASKLMDSVSRKLFEFLGNYSDSVLAEYIVVLVCNGKHQNQARADLEAFLGDESGRFVEWLWNHLSEEIYVSKVPIEASSFKTEVTTARQDIMKNQYIANRPSNIQAKSVAVSDIPLPKNERYEPSNLSTDSKTMEGSERPQSNVAKYPSSRARCYPESSLSGGQCLQYDTQLQKIAKSNSNAVNYQPSSLPKTESVVRISRSTIPEDLQSRCLSPKGVFKGRLPSAVMDGVPHQTTRPRGNVWDRLGKPCSEDDVFVRRSQHHDDVNALVREDLGNDEGLQKVKSMRLAPEARKNEETDALNSYNRVISNNLPNVHRVQDHNSQTVSTHHVTDNSKRKRHFGDFTAGNNSASFSGRKETYRQVYPKLEAALPVKHNHIQCLDDSPSEPNNVSALIPQPTCQTVNTTTSIPVLESDQVHRSQWNRKGAVVRPSHVTVPVDGSIPAKPGPIADAEESKPVHRPVHDEVLNVMSRLHQVEMEMLKLRSKQAEMNIDVKPYVLSGIQNNSEDDIESRTVLVTNVHFAATREALTLHFAKSGGVVKVILLSDSVTAQPKGAAYVVFASKEAVDKALAMSGTSFYSRILTVMRKSDMPPGFLVPAQLAGKLPQQLYPSTYKKLPAPQRNFTSSHLQWRRDQPARGENSEPATTNGLGPSSTVE